MPGLLRKLNRVRTMPDIAQIMAQAVYNVHEPTVLLCLDQRSVRLEIPGQGSCSFNFKSAPPSKSPIPACRVIKLKKKSGYTFSYKKYSDELYSNSEILRLHIYNSEIALVGSQSFRFKTACLANVSSISLLHFKESSRFLWVSVDKNNACIKVGHGYMMESNALVRFEAKNEAEKEHVRQLLEQVEKIKLDPTWPLASPLKYWRLPVVRDPPHIITAPENNTLAKLNRGRCMTCEWLPPEAKRLYSSVQGCNVQLTNYEIKCIDYSLKNHGCVLFEKLREKDSMSNVSGAKKTSYVRVGLGVDVGDSVGNPFALEIWPIGHESCVRSHGDAVGIVKVLHGAIEASFYNPLVEENNDDEQLSIKTVLLNKGDTTWLTPEFYQTHKLRNARHDTMALTIQCYNYLGSDTTHSEHFDYVSQRDQRLHRFYPKSDFCFDELLSRVKNEYSRKRRVQAMNYAGIILLGLCILYTLILMGREL